MSKEFDVCIIGSGAGAGPVAYTLAMAGKQVVVLEKGPLVTEDDFSKDEIGSCRRETYSSHLKEEAHVIEDLIKGEWKSTPTDKSGWSFWNGNVVGGSSNFMSGYFHRSKPVDFRLKSEFGAIEGAHIEDWPISYDELEPWYDMVEKVVGVSGKVVDHNQLEPRSTPDFPFPPLADHPLGRWIDEACNDLGYQSIPMPRAILSRPHNGRKACSYSVYCGSYGCNTGAKGSSRAALIDQAVASGNCELRPQSMVYELKHDATGIEEALYYDKEGNKQSVKAKIFVVAAQAIESCRLLLNSRSEHFPNGLANNAGQVGKNLLFSGGGMGSGDFYADKLSEEKAKELRIRGPFINRAVQQWYTFKHPELGKMKGGTIDFIHEHPNPIRKANRLKWGDDGNLLWGKALQEKLKYHFAAHHRVQFEVFVDWLPNDDCFVEIDPEVKDKWGIPVAKIRIGNHPRDLLAGQYLMDRAKEILAAMGAENIRGTASAAPPANLQAGGCRFGHDSQSSVLNKDCRAHEVHNLYVSDGSFMPTGGSVTYTWTIYANAFRVADKILEQMA